MLSVRSAKLTMTISEENQISHSEIAAGQHVMDESQIQYHVSGCLCAAAFCPQETILQSGVNGGFAFCEQRVNASRHLLP